MTDVLVSLSPEGLIDQLVRVRMKVDGVSDEQERVILKQQRDALQAALDQVFPADVALRDLIEQLHGVRCDLSDLETDMRACEARGDFGTGFVALARSCLALLDARDDVSSQIRAHLAAAASTPR